MAAWLIKSEPDAYSFDDLVRDGETVWDGVKNPMALRNLSAMTAGDDVVFYHTGGERQAVGTATVARAAYADPNLADPKRVVVDIRVGARLARPVALEAIKKSAAFEKSPLLRIGRLSVVAVDALQWAEIQRLAR